MGSPGCEEDKLEGHDEIYPLMWMDQRFLSIIS